MICKVIDNSSELRITAKSTKHTLSIKLLFSIIMVLISTNGCNFRSGMMAYNISEAMFSLDGAVVKGRSLHRGRPRRIGSRGPRAPHHVPGRASCDECSIRPGRSGVPDVRCRPLCTACLQPAL